MPDTLNILTPEMAPLITEAPVIVNELVPPAIVEELVIVVPVNVLSAPLNVTAPEYVCIPEVLTLAPKSETPDTVNDAAPAELSEVFCIIALRSNAPVIAIAPNGFVPPTTPLNLTVGVLDPVVIVKALAAVTSLSTVEPNTIVSPAEVDEVVKVLEIGRAHV